MALEVKDVYNLEDLNCIVGSDAALFVRLHGVESLEEAFPMYDTLSDAVHSRDWICPRLDKLSLVAGIAVEVDRIINNLIPLLLGDDKNKMVTLLLKNAAWSIRFMGKQLDAGDIFRLRMNPITNRIIKLTRLMLRARCTPTSRHDRLRNIDSELKIFRKCYYLPIP
uniref:Uncharacterized protein n=1 Tax=Oryza punctata TaxID=4537 RepID=A0A0E0L5T8_ORYPU